MTREEARQKAEIMLAYANGKEIEFYNDEDKTWASMNDPSFDNCVDYYRVKKESKYRPFKDGDECFEEMKKHEPFGWIKDSSEYLNNIQFVSDTTDEEEYRRRAPQYFNVDRACRYYLHVMTMGKQICSCKTVSD